MITIAIDTRTYPSLYRGIVESNEDPKGLGRCKIRVPAVHGALNYPIDILPWARPLVLTPVSKGRGSVNIPDVGDIVWVMFEGSERDFPIYLGGTYSNEDIPVDKDTVDFYIDEGCRISYHRGGTYSISIGATKLIMDGSLVRIVGDVKIEGDLSVEGKIHSTDSITTDSSVTAIRDVVGGSVSLKSHTHGGVYPGSSNTSSPN